MILKQLRPLDFDLTPQEICQAVGIDYQVQKLPLSYFDDGSYHQIDDKFAVVNDAGKVLSICSKHWEISQNIDIVTTAYETFKELGLKLSRVGEFADGKRIACVGNWNKSIDVGVGDIIYGQVMLIGSHEVGVGHELRAYWERLVCLNGMTERIRTTKQIFGHSTAGVQALTEALSSLENIAINHKQAAQVLINIPMSVEEATVFLIKEFGDPQKSVVEQPRVVKTVLKLFSGQGLGSDLLTSFNTAWGLLNSLTEYYCHHVKSGDKLKSLISGVHGNNVVKLSQSLHSVISNQ
jgi:hypothetical protein